MKLHRVTTPSLLAASILLVPMPLAALTWQHANSSDTNTIVLYHFDETTGTTANDAAGSRDLTHQSTDMISSAAPNWCDTPSGRYITTTQGWYSAYDTADITVNYGSGLTISFWYRTHGSMPSLSLHQYLVDFSRDSWRNENRVNLRTSDSNIWKARIHDVDQSHIDSIPSTWDDGNWHQVAIVYDPSAPSDETGKFYFDNALMTNWNANTSANTNGDMKVYVGAHNSAASTEYFIGDIDEVFIHNGVCADFSDGYGFGPTNPMLSVVPTVLTFSDEETAHTYDIASAGVGTLWTDLEKPAGAAAAGKVLQQKPTAKE